MSSELRKGASGDIVIQLSTTLNRLGLLKTALSIFDENVESAVKAFQQDRGLIVSGVVDATTMQSLEEAKWNCPQELV